MKIYLVTAIEYGYQYHNIHRNKDGIFHSYRKRISSSQRKYLGIISKLTTGWFTKLSMAKKYVEGNWCDLAEHQFNLAVIEEVPEGFVTNLPTKELWYAWMGKDWNNGKFISINKPETLKSIVCFWH